VIANLPTFPPAGAILGTSIQVRRSDDSYRIYDKFIQELEAGHWGVDAYALLGEPNAMNRVNRFPFAIVTTDDVQAIQGSMTADELHVRMVIMFAALRVTNRRRGCWSLRIFTPNGPET
jgi:hypothetical protein